MLERVLDLQTTVSPWGLTRILSPSPSLSVSFRRRWGADSTPLPGVLPARCPAKGSGDSVRPSPWRAGTFPHSFPESCLWDTRPRRDFQTSQGGLRGHLTQHARIQAPSHFKSPEQSSRTETMELGPQGDLGQLTDQTAPEMEMETARSLLMGLSGREGDARERKQLRSLVHSKGAGLSVGAASQGRPTVS